MVLLSIRQTRPPGYGAPVRYWSTPNETLPTVAALQAINMIRLLLALACLAGTVVVHAQELATASPAENLFHQGVKAYNMGDYAGAIERFTQVINTEPDHLNAYLQRGFCHSLQGEYPDAVADFTEVIQRKPDHLWAYTSRGGAYNKWGRTQQAIADFNAALNLDPTNQEAFNNRGWAKKAQGDLEGACADWTSSRKLGNDEAKIILKNNPCH